MDSAVNNAVSASMAMQQAMNVQEAQMNLTRKVLDNQANVVTSLIQGAVAPQLATEGTLGTQINTYA